MRFVMAGASGFLGQALTAHLRRSDHEVVRLVRRAPRGADEASWDPFAGRLDDGLIRSADVVVNLAGAPLAHWPWTASYKETFLKSRTVTTRLLADKVAAAQGEGQGPVFVAQNGVAGYGDRGSEVITEETPTDGDAFIADVTRQWEAAAEPAVAAGARVVVLRTGVVLGAGGGALGSMLPIFKLGVGGRIGSGQQYFATISLQDWVSATTHLATTDGCSGAYNLTAPGTTTNAEFTEELGNALHRPTFLRVPALPLRTLGGVAGGELLSSARVEPARLSSEPGFSFAHPTLPAQVAAALH